MNNKLITIVYIEILKRSTYHETHSNIVAFTVFGRGVLSACELFKPKAQEGKKEITVIVDLRLTRAR